MKVTLEKNYKNIYTISDVFAAKAVIEYVKEYEDISVKEYAMMAAREAAKTKGDYVVEILKAEATTAKNCRARNAYSDTSWDMDVWVTATAKTSFGFIEIGAYLTDIWMTGAVNYTDEMFIQYYKMA